MSTQSKSGPKESRHKSGYEGSQICAACKSCQYSRSSCHFASLCCSSSCSFCKSNTICPVIRLGSGTDGIIKTMIKKIKQVATTKPHPNLIQPPIFQNWPTLVYKHCVRNTVRR